MIILWVLLIIYILGVVFHFGFGCCLKSNNVIPADGETPSWQEVVTESILWIFIYALWFGELIYYSLKKKS